MKCTSCGSDFASDQLKCPYCGSINEHALQLAKELQTYDAAYEQKRDELLETGTNQVLKHLTIGLGITFLVIVIAAFGFLSFYQYRFGENSAYEVTGVRLAKNKEQIARYLEEKQYLRAYLLASCTDPSGEYFEYYPEYDEELTDIYHYSLVLIQMLQSMEAMDRGDNYASLQDAYVDCASIFYRSLGDSEVSKDLETEMDGILMNYYRLTKEEVEELKVLESGKQLRLDGSADVQAVTKKRMVEYFGK